MKCEIIAIGTELLLGQIEDTNSTWIAQQLALQGIHCHFQTRVGDNIARIVDAFEIALARADIIICCGGLGPTQDDITRHAMAQVMGVTLFRDEALVQQIRAQFVRRQRVMSDNNLLQADRPVGSEVLSAMPGTAPGLKCAFTWRGLSKTIYAVPGVPSEMREMLNEAILPDLREQLPDAMPLFHRTLKAWGMAESSIAELLNPLSQRLDTVSNPTLAYLASGINGIKLRLTAQAASKADALEIIAPVEAEIRQLLGEVVFGADEHSMESVVLQQLRQAHLTLAVAESVTGGLVCARLTEVAGASEVLRGGVVSYANSVKYNQLKVEQGAVVSRRAAEQMAQGVRELLQADVGISTTGVAGPDKQEGIDVGTVFMGISFANHTESFEIRLPGSRQQIREHSVIYLLNQLRLYLQTQHHLS